MNRICIAVCVACVCWSGRGKARGGVTHLAVEVPSESKSAGEMCVWVWV